MEVLSHVSFAQVISHANICAFVQNFSWQSCFFVFVFCLPYALTFTQAFVCIDNNVSVTVCHHIQNIPSCCSIVRECVQTRHAACLFLISIFIYFFAKIHNLLTFVFSHSLHIQPTRLRFSRAIILTSTSLSMKVCYIFSFLNKQNFSY